MDQLLHCGRSSSSHAVVCANAGWDGFSASAVGPFQLDVDEVDEVVLCIENTESTVSTES